MLNCKYQHDVRLPVCSWHASFHAWTLIPARQGMFLSLSNLGLIIIWRMVTSFIFARNTSDSNSCRANRYQLPSLLPGVSMICYFTSLKAIRSLYHKGVRCVISRTETCCINEKYRQQPNSLITTSLRAVCFNGLKSIPIINDTSFEKLYLIYYNHP